MFKHNSLIILIITLLLACQEKNNIKKGPSLVKSGTHKINTIHIVPLGKVNRDILSGIAEGLKKFYQKEIIIDNTESLSNDLLAPSGKRFSASKILAKFNNSNVTLIITEKDIVAKKGDIDEYGIFGLGIQPGKTCVVSPFRPRWNSTPALLIDRMQKISIHEVGHNLGLGHCTKNQACLMNAANGTIKQVDKEKMFFCNDCIKLLK